MKNASPMSSFAAHCLTVAASMPVDVSSYARHQSSLNLAKLKALSNGYKQGWLHNVLARITPLTVRDAHDYTLMAELFIQTPKEAENLLAKFRTDITRYAVTAGINHHAPESARYQQLLTPHIAIYTNVAKAFATRFGIKVASPFVCITIKAEKPKAQTTAQITFIRDFLKTRRAA